MVEITFSNSINEVSAFGLTQWDKGQKLKIIWSDMPASFQVHFASRNSSEAIVVNAKSAKGEAVVEIPDELLKNSADIYAWIYVIEGDKVGESTKRAVLYVRPRAKPHTLVDELEMTQQEILENILADINENIKNIKENGVDSQYLPDYVTAETERVLAKVLECQTEDSVVFIASSDAHLKTGDYNSETALKHMSQAMRLMAERYPVDFSAYLGDMTSGGSDKDISEAENEIMRVNAALFPAYHTMPSFICAGSEDYLLNSYYRNGNYISDAELKKLICKRNKDFYDGAYSERGYFFKDFAQQKIRVICLNTSDTFGESLTPTSETAVMSLKQLQWLCNSLDLSAKSDASKWGIILLGHHPLNMIGKFNLAVEVLDAYNKGASVSKAVQSGETVVYDFAGKNSAKILGQFHGHLHSYKVGFITDANIPVVSIPNASYYNNNFYSADIYTQQENQTYSDEITYNKRVNSATDTAFCVVVINKTSGRIDAVHYGAGVDRVIEGNHVTEDNPSPPNGTEPDSGDDNTGDNIGDDNGGGNSGGNTGDDSEGGNSGDNNGNENEGGNSGGNTGDENEGGNSGDNTGDGNEGGNSGDNNGNENQGGNSGGNTSSTYTNLVPTSITAYKVIYNSVGYNNNFKLNEQGDTAYGRGYVCTGHMQTNYGDVMRIAGGTYDGSMGNYILVYDEEFKLLWKATLNGVDDEASGIFYKDLGVVEFYTDKVQGVNLKNMKYMRLTTIGLGESIIVTRNERIYDLQDSIGGGIVLDYVNIVPYSTDESGNAYGVNGYLNGKKLNASGVEASGVGFATTGYFVLADSNAVIRTKGATFDGSEGCCICVYDSNFTLIRCITLSEASDSANGISYSDGIHTFTPADATDSLGAYAYCRISGKCNGVRLIVTYCEEID